MVQGLRRFVAAVILLTSTFTTAFGAEQWLQSKVRTVYPLSDGNFVVTFHSDHPNCTAPQSPKYFYVSVGQNGVTEAGRQALLAVVLAAAATKSDVAVAFDDSSSACYINRISANIGE